MQPDETEPRELYLGKTAQIPRSTVALTLSDTQGSLALNNCRELWQGSYSKQSLVSMQQ